jgi:hypothetical protein
MFKARSSIKWARADSGSTYRPFLFQSNAAAWLWLVVRLCRLRVPGCGLADSLIRPG